MERRLQIRSGHGYALATAIGGPSDARAGVLMLHGFGSGKDNKLNRELVPILTGLGIATCRFDFAGHGESGGDTLQLTIASGADDAIEVATHFRAQGLAHEARLAVVASSFGGSVALRAIRKLLPLSALFLRAPIPDYVAVRRAQYGDAGIRDWKKSGTIEVDSSKGPLKSGYAFFKDAKAHDAFKAVKNLDVPTLIVHGDKDDNVPVEQSTRLVGAIGPRAKLVVVPGAGHGFSEQGHFQTLLAECRTFLRSELLGG